MTKATLVEPVKERARDLGLRGITINNFQAGLVDTAMNPVTGAFARTLIWQMALPRYGTGHENAGLVVYLTSPEAAYVTGAA